MRGIIPLRDFFQVTGVETRIYKYSKGQENNLPVKKILEMKLLYDL